MQNMSDDELDKIFQEAAGKSEHAFEPAAWDAMNKLLDEKPSHGLAGINKKLAFSIVIIGLLITGLFYFVWNNQPHTVSDNLEMSSTYPVNKNKPDDENNLPADHGNPEKEREPSWKKRESDQPKNISESNSDSLSNRTKTFALTPVQKNKPAQKSFSEISDHNDVAKSNLPDEQTILKLSSAEHEAASADSSYKKEVVGNENLKNKNDYPSMVQNPRRVGYGLGIKLALSPDFTSIGYGRVDRMGFNYGVMAEYQFMPKWVLSAGAILSRKIYSGNDIEYTFNDKKYTANKLTGDCRIIDIPLNVYYIVKPQNNFTFFAGIGITSYLMLTEDYTYTVNSSYGNKEFYREVKGENNEWLKLLNISFGVQKRLSDKMVLQFEPFLKAPLAGVGEGKVSLASLGAFLNVKYSFKKRLSDKPDLKRE